jgi:uncharacterized coiled-coil protein SlyX
MRTEQRDVHNTPKRRMSISYDELETFKKSIKVSVLNELRAEIENVSDQESLKDTVLSEIRTELMGIPNPALLKASILNELRTELNAPREKESGAADRRLRELAGIQEGLVRELLDQKMIIKKLETEIGNLTKKLEDMKNTTQTPPPSVSLTLHDDPLDLPPLSRKPKRNPEFRKETPAYGMIELREAPAPLPGTSARVQLKFREVEPRELEEEEIETKCEYIIAESGDKRRFKGNMRQQQPAEPVRQPPPRQPSSSVRQSSPRQPPSSVRQPSSGQPSSSVRQPSSEHPQFNVRQPAYVKADSVRPRPADDYKCEYIIAEKTQKKHLIEESVDLRENEDAELITCSRKNPRAF